MAIANGALTMPNNYAVMDEEEMMYLEGGARQVYLNGNMLNKNYCLSIAKNYTTETGLSQSRIAKEIFGHAVLYLSGAVANESWLINLNPLAPIAISYIKSHSNPVDIGDDPWYRVAVYEAIWLNVPSA